MAPSNAVVPFETGFSGAYCFWKHPETSFMRAAGLLSVSIILYDLTGILFARARLKESISVKGKFNSPRDVTVLRAVCHDY